MMSQTRHPRSKSKRVNFKLSRRMPDGTEQIVHVRGQLDTKLTADQLPDFLLAWEMAANYTGRIRMHLA